jgi:hypothetical protein
VTSPRRCAVSRDTQARAGAVKAQRRHAIFHSVARQFLQFVRATGGDPHYDRFWPWLNKPEQHALMHSFMDASRSQNPEKSAREFLEVLAAEWGESEPGR